MKSYLEICFMQNKLFWAFVLGILIFGIVMQFVLLDSYTACWVYGLDAFISLFMAIGSYIYKLKNEL